MSPPDPYKPAKPEMVTTTGVTVFVSDLYYRYPEEDAEPPPPDPGPMAIVFPPGQSIADRNEFIKGVEKQCGPLIVSMLRRRDINPESARELYQEAMVILLNDHKKLEGPPAKVTRYVETVVKHLILNHGGLARLKCASDDDVDEQVAVAKDPEQTVAHAELWHKMEGYVDRLSKEEAEVFKARELHGMIFEVIAKAVGRPLDTVYSQHTRAMEKLRAMARASERPAALRASLPEKARR